jgi:hypothetical protein
MHQAPAHTFQVLTKRPQRMARLLGGDEFYPQQVVPAVLRRRPGRRQRAMAMAAPQRLAGCERRELGLRQDAPRASVPPRPPCGSCRSNRSSAPSTCAARSRDVASSTTGPSGPTRPTSWHPPSPTTVHPGGAAIAGSPTTSAGSSSAASPGPAPGRWRSPGSKRSSTAAITRASPYSSKQLGSGIGGASHHDIDTFPALLQVRSYPIGRKADA